MKIYSYSNNNIKSQNFGMAKLTEKGRIAVQSYMTSIPKFSADKAYFQKDVLADLLLNNKRLPVTQDALNDIFECGMSESSLQNKFFAKNQLLTSKGKNAIRTFLKIQTTDKTSEIGNGLINNVIAFFDRNISNERISAKESKKILDTVKDYANPEEISQRLSIVMDKMFSK